MNRIRVQLVKFPELIAAAAPLGAIGAWVLNHVETINSALRAYTLLVGAIGGTFAMLWWIRRWYTRKD